jgi:hypothetical protein
VIRSWRGCFPWRSDLQGRNDLTKPAVSIMHCNEQSLTCLGQLATTGCRDLMDKRLALSAAEPRLIQHPLAYLCQVAARNRFRRYYYFGRGIDTISGQNCR